MRLMRSYNCIAPVWPAFARFQGRVDPLAEVWNAGQHARDGLGHEFRANPCTKRIDRFRLSKVFCFFRPQNMVGMNHLRDPVEQFHLARNKPFLARWQKLLQVVAARMKEDQLKFGQAVADMDPVGPTTAARWMMCADAHLYRGSSRKFQPPQTVAARAVNQVVRKVKNQIARCLDMERAEILCCLWPNSLQCLQTGKKWKKYLRAARHLRPPRSAPAKYLRQ